MCDLPGPWSSAKSVPARQRATRSALGADAHLRAEGTGSPVIVVVRDAAFRCSQRVEAFMLRRREGVYLLIQPADMEPLGVAKCDDLYDVAVQTPLMSGAELRGIFLRGDRYAGPSRIERVPLGGEQVGGWADEWRRAASDAWSQYKDAFRETLPW